MTNVLRSQFNDLQLPLDATGADKRRRGLRFEEFLKSLLEQDRLSPRIRFRPTGEELDGSFLMDNKVFLLEAKWHAKRLPASAIYAFKGKVDGKLVGTIGVFISISSYSEDAIDALTAGKGLNVVLFDENDVEAAISHGFAHVLRVKLRAAAEEGAVFYPFTTTFTQVDSDNVSVDYDLAIDDIAAQQKQVLIICEGNDDRKILNQLGQRILKDKLLSASIRLMVAHGKHGIPRIANAIYPLLPPETAIIAVIDGDSEAEEIERMITSTSTVPMNLVIVEPEIEAWLVQGSTNPKEDVKKLARLEKIPIEQYVFNLIEAMNISMESGKGGSFQEFSDTLIRAVNS